MNLSLKTAENANIGNKILILFAISLLNIMCNNNLPETITDSIGFVFATNEAALDNTLILHVNFSPIPRSMPIINIDSCKLDTFRSDYYSRIYYGLQPGQLIRYSIQYLDDFIRDSFLVPYDIDSIYCNGYYSANNRSNIVYMPYDTNIRLCWKVDQNNDCYRIQISSMEINPIHRFVSDTCLQDIIHYEIPRDTIYYSVAICGYYGNEFINGSEPNMVSNRIYVYYEIYGNSYITNYLAIK